MKSTAYGLRATLAAADHVRRAGHGGLLVVRRDDGRFQPRPLVKSYAAAGLLVDRGRADGYTGGMSDREPTDCEERLDQLGKVRTWWHPLLARLLGHALATEYRVLEEVLVE